MRRLKEALNHQMDASRRAVGKNSGVARVSELRGHASAFSVPKKSDERKYVHKFFARSPIIFTFLCFWMGTGREIRLQPVSNGAGEG